MEVFQEEEKEKNRSTRILLIVNLIIWGIILFIVMLFNGVVNAQTINFNTYNTVDASDYSYNWGTSYTWHTMNGSIKRFEYVWGNVNAGYYEGHITLDLDYTGYYNITKNNIQVQCRGTSAVLNCANNIEFSKNVNQSRSLYDIDVYFNGTLDSTQYFQVRIIFDTNNYPPTGIKFRGSGSIDWSQTDNATNTTINNATSQIITNNNNNTNILVENQNQNTAEIISAIGGLEGYHTHYTPDTEDFDDLEDAEDTLHQYTNVDLDDFEVSIDSNTSNWVWNTLTSLLNTSSIVFGYVISILSIGLIKLILNR